MDYCLYHLDSKRCPSSAGRGNGGRRCWTSDFWDFLKGEFTWKTSGNCYHMFSGKTWIIWDFGTTPHFSLVKCLENFQGNWYHAFLRKTNWTNAAFEGEVIRVDGGKVFSSTQQRLGNATEKARGKQNVPGKIPRDPRKLRRLKFFWKCCSFYDRYQWPFLL